MRAIAWTNELGDIFMAAIRGVIYECWYDAAREDDWTNLGKAVYVTYVTTEGLKRNSYANDIQSGVMLDDLFQE